MAHFLVGVIHVTSTKELRTQNFQKAQKGLYYAGQNSVTVAPADHESAGYCVGMKFPQSGPELRWTLLRLAQRATNCSYPGYAKGMVEVAFRSLDLAVLYNTSRFGTRVELEAARAGFIRAIGTCTFKGSPRGRPKRARAATCIAGGVQIYSPVATRHCRSQVERFRHAGSLALRSWHRCKCVRI